MSVTIITTRLPNQTYLVIFFEMLWQCIERYIPLFSHILHCVEDNDVVKNAEYSGPCLITLCNGYSCMRHEFRGNNEWGSMHEACWMTWLSGHSVWHDFNDEISANKDIANSATLNGITSGHELDRGYSRWIWSCDVLTLFMLMESCRACSGSASWDKIKKPYPLSIEVRNSLLLWPKRHANHTK